MAKTRGDSQFIDYVLIFAGAGIMAASISLVFLPAGLVTGGFTGLAIIIKSISQEVIPGGMPLWITNMVLNIPLILAGIAIKGRKFMMRSIFGAVVLSFWLAVIPEKELVTGDLLLSSIVGGVLQGMGIGLVFLGRGTTGGSDTLSALIQHRLRYYTIAQVMQVVDACIVAAGGFVFGIAKALYAIVAIFIIAKVTDGLLEGMKFAKAAYIITEKPEVVTKAIMKELPRGVTGIPAKGMYSGQEKTMLFCVVSKKQIVALKEIVSEADAGAFIIVSDAREVLGEGFLETKN